MSEHDKAWNHYDKIIDEFKDGDNLDIYNFPCIETNYLCETVIIDGIVYDVENKCKPCIKCNGLSLYINEEGYTAKCLRCGCEFIDDEGVL